MTEQQAIQFCRDNSQRRSSVLGFAQERCPLAYQDYIDNANKNLGLTHYFNTTENKPQHLKFRFVQREQELRELK